MISLGQWLAANADLDRRDRELLLCEAAGISRARLLADPQAPLQATDRARLDAWAARRRAGEPVAYLLGSQGFRDFELRVSPAVLIPRPETELLVETVLERLEHGQRVLELGTGSGAIAIALARDSLAHVTGADISQAALEIAMTNARHLGAVVRWIESDWFAAISERFHVIVSNPPYVAAGDAHLEALRHEPALALVSGPDGLDALRCIIDQAPSHLEPGGWLVLEHGCAQGRAVRGLLAQRAFTAIETRQDLAGLDRVTLGRMPVDRHGSGAH